MNRITLEERRNLLLKDREDNQAAMQEVRAAIARSQQVLANAQAFDHTVNGAIQECDRWIAEFPPDPEPIKLLEDLKVRRDRSKATTGV